MRLIGKHCAARPGGRRWWPYGAVSLLLLLLLPGAAGCSLDGLLKSDELPRDVSDPAITETPDGARRAYRGVLVRLDIAFDDFVISSGLFADELTSIMNNRPDIIDQRSMPNGSDAVGTLYGYLHKVRGQAQQALGLLKRHLPDDPDLAGHLYAVQGYAELFLAELFCSGIPLSTLDFEGDYTLRPASSTDEVMAHAVALFDTALATVRDSTAFISLARVGRARALLNRGEYAEAAATVAEVPSAYRYELLYLARTGSSSLPASPPNRFFLDPAGGVGVNVPNREGGNGMDWRTSNDPRTSLTPYTYQLSSFDFVAYHPNKYAVDGGSPVVLASGVEARLIQAEAQLQASSEDNAWLVTLNALRTDGTFHTVPTEDPNDDPAAVDTIWHRGSGGYDRLAPLEDPGTSQSNPTAADSVRVDLLFRERAFWLFLEGHRQGDLRRLLRQYSRDEGDVYPVDTYGAVLSSTVIYGSDVTAPVPASEMSANPLYLGCTSRGA